MPCICSNTQGHFKKSPQVVPYTVAKTYGMAGLTDDLSAWFSGSTTIFGFTIPNQYIVYGGGALLAVGLLMSGRRGRR